MYNRTELINRINNSHKERIIKEIEKANEKAFENCLAVFYVKISEMEKNGPFYYWSDDMIEDFCREYGKKYGFSISRKNDTILFW